MRDAKESAPREAQAEETDVDAEPTESLIELLLEPPQAEAAPLAEPARIDGVLVGRVVAVEPEALVAFDGGARPGVPARVMTVLVAEDVGAEVALLFEGGDPRRPVVMGKMAKRPAAPVVITDDGERVHIAADKTLVISCGEASITLTREGKVLIKGAYVSSRATGTHRIQGGNVEIN